MPAWSIALEGGPKWVMTNGYGQGLTNTVHVDYDKETMDYLRNTLGYEGIVAYGERILEKQEAEALYAGFCAALKGASEVSVLPPFSFLKAAAFSGSPRASNNFAVFSFTFGRMASR